MEITTLAVSMFETNCHLVYDKAAGEGVIIDPGDEADRIEDEIARLGFRATAILLTHGHGDHIGAVAALKRKLSIPVVAGTRAEQMIMFSNKHFSAMFGVSVSCPPPDRFLGEGDTVPFGSVSLGVISTPGHSPEGVCFSAPGVVFCGDTLFCGSIGRTDLPGGDFEQLIDAITAKLLVLPDETICYPGHGPTTTIGEERRCNPFLTGRS
jgi:hydroxyacylglutathione hydrolase